MNGIKVYVERYGDTIIGRTNHDVYEDYVGMCKELGYKVLAFRTFMIHLCANYPYRTKQRCTRAGMIQYIEEREIDKGIVEYLEGRTSEDLEGVSTELCYTHYKGVCDTLGIEPMPRNHFSRKVCRVLDMRTKNAYAGKEKGYNRVFTANR